MNQQNLPSLLMQKWINSSKSFTPNQNPQVSNKYKQKFKKFGLGSFSCLLRDEGLLFAFSDGWQKCWEEELTPWDLGSPTPVLVHLHNTGSLPKGRALVPGCGSVSGFFFLLMCVCWWSSIYLFFSSSFFSLFLSGLFFILFFWLFWQLGLMSKRSKLQLDVRCGDVLMCSVSCTLVPFFGFMWYW